MATGGGAAYQRLQKTDNAISQGLQYWGGIAARENQQNKNRQEREGVRQQQRQDKMNENFAQDITILEPVITGVESVDEINYRATTNAQQRIGDIYREFRKNPEAQADVGLRMELSNLKSFPKTLAKTQEELSTSYKTFSEGYMDGTISKWDEDKADEMSAFFGVKGEDGKITPNYVIDFNEKGNMVAKGLTKDGKFFEKSINEMMSDYSPQAFTKSIDSEVYTTDFAKSLGKKQELKVGRGLIQTVQDFSLQEETVRGYIQAGLGDSDDPTDLAKSVWTDENNMGRDKSEFNEKSLKEIEDHLVEQVRMKYDTTVSAKQTRKETAAGKSDKEKKQDSIQIMMDTSTGKPSKIYTNPNDKEQFGAGFTIAEPITTGVGNKEKKINKLYLNSNGDVTFKGEEKVTQSSSKTVGNYTIGGGAKETVYKPVQGGGLNSEELNVVANRAGYDNAIELKKALEAKAESAGFSKESTKLEDESEKVINDSKPLEADMKKLAEKMKISVKEAEELAAKNRAKYGY